MPNRETPYERSVIRATEAALAYIAPALRATRADYIRIMEWRMALDGFVPTGMSGRTVTTGGVQRAVTGRAVYLPPAEWRRWLDHCRVVAKRRANGMRPRQDYLAQAAALRASIVGFALADSTLSQNALAKKVGSSRRTVQHALGHK